MTQEELNKILELHKKWLNKEEDGVLANLENVDLRNANLNYANLSNADLRYANLTNANLTNANLCYADLHLANLRYANLRNADIDGANLINTILDENEQIRKGIILKESMIGYKKCRNRVIVTLEIPKGAVVFSISNSIYRTNKAKVIDISSDNKIAYSKYDYDFKYEIGKEIEIEDFNMQYNYEDTTGIHFYRTKEEAENC